jgi:fructose-1,6-bisphosphatase
MLDIQPDSLHQRTPFIVGSREEVELLAQFLERR